MTNYVSPDPRIGGKRKLDMWRYFDVGMQNARRCRRAFVEFDVRC